MTDVLIKRLCGRYRFLAFVIQFSFVACFFWLNVMCIETWSLVRHHVNDRTYRTIQPKTLFFYYSIWAWGPSAILILISMAMDLSPMIPMTYVKPTFGSDSCWFKCKSIYRSRISSNRHRSHINEALCKYILLQSNKYMNT